MWPHHCRLSCPGRYTGLLAFILLVSLAGNPRASAQPAGISPPELSLQPGYYAPGQLLEIRHPDKEISIYYTLDGSPPSTASHTYHSPLLLEKPSPAATDISLIRSNPVETDEKGFGWKPPEAYHKAMVITAVACRDDTGCSPPATATYFIGLEVPSLPVISIITDPFRLFDHQQGIYIPGIIYEQRGYGDGHYGQNNANYFQTGDEWEVPSGFEFFEQGQLQLKQRVGIRIHGGGTRALPMKSLRIYARSEYGKTYLNHPIFPDQQYSHYKRIILRNAGQDFYSAGTLLRDGMLQKLAEPLRQAIQDYRPGIVYLNGEYWGIHNIRERYDNHYFKRKYHIPEQELDFLESRQLVIEGNNTHYLAMLDFIRDNDLSDPGVYREVQTMMDTDNYIDYFITNVYSNNKDWPGHNLNYWRRQASYNPHAAWGTDGRWRWALNDLDFGFGRADGSGAYRQNTLAYATDPNGGSWPPNPPWSTLLIRELLKNPDFKNALISRFADLLNTVFSIPHVLTAIQQASDAVQPAMQQHIDRWAYPADNMNQWATHVNRLKTFAVNRPSHQRQHILEHFGLSGSFRLTADVAVPSTGIIQVNQLVISPDNPLLAHSGSSYPWSGSYFNNVPFPLKAIPAPGFVFQKWITASGETFHENPLWINTATDLELTAVFVEDPRPAPLLLHYWHFNHLPPDPLQQIAADHSVTGNAFISYPGTGSGYMDAVNDGSLLNIAREAEAGGALRVRNPSDTRHLEIRLPTSGFSNIRLSYAVKRTPNGARQQALWYRENDAEPWKQFGEFINPIEDYQEVSFDFSQLEAAINNPGFQVRLSFLGPYAPGSSGNNRFDNIRLEGRPIENANIPPMLSQALPFGQLIEQGEALELDLREFFTDPEGDPLAYTASSNRPREAGVSLSGSSLRISPLRRGDAEIVVGACDGYNPPAKAVLRVLVYPQAYAFPGKVFSFTHWSSGSPEREYPEHMLFLQSDTTDPGPTQPLLYPYHIAHDDFHASDQGSIGFPYNNSGRSRINGLGSEGISFINTGRNRDLGGALLALNTTGLSACLISFTATTLQPNSRIYHLRLQYRTALDEAFRDLADQQGPAVEYRSQEKAGHKAIFEDIPLPAEALGQPYLQLLWRYYYSGEQREASGQRTMIGLGGIRAAASLAGFPQEDGLLVLFPNPASTRLMASISGLQTGELTWQITDLRGRILMQNIAIQEGYWQQWLDISHLPPGIFFLRLITERQVYSNKFLIIRN